MNIPTIQSVSQYLRHLVFPDFLNTLWVRSMCDEFCSKFVNISAASMSGENEKECPDFGARRKIYS